MIRTLLAAAVAALVLATPVEAKRAIRVFSPMEKLVHADAVVVGTVTAVEKELVNAKSVPDAPDKITYQIAVIKVENGLVGVPNVTHVKVGFIPPPPDRAEPPAVPFGRPAPIRGGFGPVYLTKGQQGLFYLTKHHSGEFYIINPISAPIDSKADGYKNELALAKKVAAALADPTKALKAEKADDRLFAANVLINKYRAYPANGGAVVTEKVPANESALILKVMAAASWKPDPKNPESPNAYLAFSQLGLTPQDGWKYPMVKPGEDYVEKTREAYVAWLAGPGKDYQIKKFATKKK